MTAGGKHLNIGEVGISSEADELNDPEQSESPDSPLKAHSCLKNSSKSPRRIRADSRGILIESGKKQHKVLFRDEVKEGAPLEEVREVAAIKNDSTSVCCTLM
mmetsp:Transcript_60928/g.108225  ORF Transcript_60928/g.108225 Transcript_60928/m.108225 type:complete len:103 (-) Transcript_60928:101-409(-)